jgi:GxxExxY protein
MIDLSQYANKVYKIIGAAMSVHSELGYGLLEPVYQEAMHLELLDRGIANEREQEIEIYYKKHLLEKKYRMDIVVDDIIIELKSVNKLISAHRAQLCNYLRLTRKPLGLLINFGEESLIGERWAYDKTTNECYIVDRNLEPIDDYEYLLDDDEVDDEEEKN